RFSRPVESGSRPGRCPTTPIDWRTRCGSRATSIPATRASPLSARESVVRILTVVDLPAPLGPSRPKIVPPSTSKLRPSRAWMPPLYVFLKSDASIACMWSLRARGYTLTRESFYYKNTPMSKRSRAELIEGFIAAVRASQTATELLDHSVAEYLGL